MRVVLGDDCGLVKVYSVDRQELISKFGEQTRATHQITSMSWGRSESEICRGIKQGSVLVTDASGEQMAACHNLGGAPVGVGVTGSDDSAKLLSVTDNGQAAIHSWSGDVVSTFSVPGPVQKAVFHKDGKTVGLGGQENEFQMWNMETQQRLFIARNVPDDMLRLRVPVWVTDCAWFEGSTAQKAIISTAYGQLRIYDIKAQRRPVHNLEVNKARITSIALSSDERTVYFGDAQGELGAWDLKANKLRYRIKGIGGAIRGLALHPTLPLLASAGLDRHLRVHNTDTRESLCRVYVKQLQNSVLFASDGPEKKKTKEQKMERKADKMWSKLGVASDDEDGSDSDGSDGDSSNGHLDDESDSMDEALAASDNSDDSSSDSDSNDDSDSS